MNNYTLNNSKDTPKNEKGSFLAAFRKMWSLMREEKRHILFAFIAITINSGLTLLGPYLVGVAINKFIITGQYSGVLMYSGILLGVYFAAFIANYFQMTFMGRVGIRVLFKLRNAIFTKLQELPVAFFNQNKSGDLISRINNDTDKLNQFFSETLTRFVGSVFIIIGAAFFFIFINPKLGLLALLPAVCIFIITRVLSGVLKRKNLKSLQSSGAMSAEIQESLSNFKVIIAFNRRDYFREKFNKANYDNFKASVSAGLVNNILSPIYDFASNAAQLIVLAYGIYLISQGSFTIGFLITFLTYITRFYDPLRQLATLWSSLQTALAGWDRISEILNLETNLKTIPESSQPHLSQALLSFQNVSFKYEGGKDVLKNINFNLESGKTYALVGPTGGGKTTTASLMARLYDPTEGTVLLNGKDIRTLSTEERSKNIGFILQEPFLFTGTLKDNILYGNPEYISHSTEQVTELLKDMGLFDLMARFEQGLDTKVVAGSDSISLGQRQLIAFIRAILRKPKLLILDEATANIDTVTEQLLEEILTKLPKETTRVIIAHRLNTIENADEIFFVNSGEITAAGSMDHALELLLHGKRQS